MRSIARIESHDEALLAGAHMLAGGVDCKIEEGGEGSLIWVLDENKLERGRELLQEFLADPNKERYSQSLQKAREIAREMEEAEERARKNHIDVGKQWRKGGVIPPVTLTLLVVCVGLWLIPAINPALLLTIQEWLMISAPGKPFMEQIMSGQVWRLITPALLHLPLRLPDSGIDGMGLLHIFFNMLWLKDLGPIIERREGSLKMLVLFLLLAALPNLLQYYFAGPNFLGFSGVVFGLLGYLWMRGRYDTRWGLRLNPGVVWFMLIWFGFTMLTGGFADYGHGGGLVLGGLIGYACSDHWRRFLGI